MQAKRRLCAFEYGFTYTFHKVLYDTYGENVLFALAGYQYDSDYFRIFLPKHLFAPTSAKRIFFFFFFQNLKKKGTRRIPAT